MAHVHSEQETVAAISGQLSRFATALLRSGTDAILRLARQHDLSMPRVMVLLHLDKAGAESISGLAEVLALSLAATSQLVDQLVCSGYVSRREDPADRRTKLVALAEAGQRFVADLRQARVTEMAQRLAHMPPEHLQPALAAIAQLNAFLENE